MERRCACPTWPRWLDSQEDIRNAGLVNDKPAVDVELYRQPEANIIDVVDRVQALMPLVAGIGSGFDPSGRRGSAHDDDQGLGARCAGDSDHLRHPGDSGGLLLSAQSLATAIPSVAVPLSLVGTFGVMYLLHYSIDNLSLMALTISTGFVVDDAIVVIENISRYLDQGLSPMRCRVARLA